MQTLKTVPLVVWYCAVLVALLFAILAYVAINPRNPLKIYQDTKAECIERGISERECEQIALEVAY